MPPSAELPRRELEPRVEPSDSPGLGDALRRGLEAREHPEIVEQTLAALRGARDSG